MRFSHVVPTLPSILLALAPSGLPAQIRVNVRLDSAGPPGSAEVLLWQGDSIFRAFVSPAGSAVLPAGDIRRPGTLLVRSVGFRPVRLSLPLHDSTVTVILDPVAATRLGAVTVSAPRPDCRQADDPAARRLWIETAAHYTTVTGARGFAAWGTYFVGEVARDSVGLVDSGQPDVSGNGRIATNARARIGRSDAAENAFYAERIRYRPGTSYSFNGLFFEWRYSRLHSTSASHFATRGFADEVTLAFEQQTPDAVVLRFCSRSHQRPYISGTLTVQNGRFERGTWNFVTDDPTEGAEGSSIFGEWVTGNERPHLVALWGVFARRIARSNRAMQEVTTASRWLISADSTAPRVDIR